MLKHIFLIYVEFRDRTACITIISNSFLNERCTLTTELFVIIIYTLKIEHCIAHFSIVYEITLSNKS